MMSPGPAPAPRLGLHSEPPSTQRVWRPRTFNTNFVCATEHYSPRAFAACCDGPVTNSSVPLEAKSAVSPGGVCAAYCYVDEMRIASNERNPHAYSDLYTCLVEMSGEGGRSGLETVHGEWVAVNEGGRGGSTHNLEDKIGSHKDENELYHTSKHQNPAPMPSDIDSDTGELIVSSARHDDEEDELRKRSTVDQTLAPEADSGNHQLQDPNDNTNVDPKLANPDEAPKDNNGQPIVPDRPAPYSYTYSTTSTPLVNSTTGTAATPTIETGFSTVPAPSSANASSTLPTQTGTQTEAPNAGRPTSTSAATPAAGRLKDAKGGWGAGKWGCLVAALAGGWAATMW
ncbi:hypothetical protein HDK64DRAFT_265695 [Phyllosticta capitalensis]